MFKCFLINHTEISYEVFEHSLNAYCLVGYLSTIVWTHAFLGILYAHFLFLYLHLFSAMKLVSHRKALEKDNHYHLHNLKQTKAKNK